MTDRSANDNPTHIPRPFQGRRGAYASAPEPPLHDPPHRQKQPGGAPPPAPAGRLPPYAGKR